MSNLRITDLTIHGPCDHPSRAYPNIYYEGLLYSENGIPLIRVKFDAKIQFTCEQVRWFYDKFKSGK